MKRQRSPEEQTFYDDYYATHSYDHEDLADLTRMVTECVLRDVGGGSWQMTMHYWDGKFEMYFDRSAVRPDDQRIVLTHHLRLDIEVMNGLKARKPRTQQFRICDYIAARIKREFRRAPTEKLLGTVNHAS